MVADPKPGFLQTRDSRKPETRVWKKGAGFAFPTQQVQEWCLPGLPVYSMCPIDNLLHPTGSRMMPARPPNLQYVSSRQPTWPNRFKNDAYQAFQSMFPLDNLPYLTQQVQEWCLPGLPICVSSKQPTQPNRFKNDACQTSQSTVCVF